MKNKGLGLLLMLVHAACFAQVSDSVVYPVVTVEAQRISEAIGSSVFETDTLLYKLLRSKGLTQVLETESFISTRAYNPGGTANFSVRGSGSQHTQVVWEGIPINDPMLGQTDLSTISLGGISNVRVLYGSAGLTNNSGGIGGTIELLSAEPRTKDGLDANLNVYAGSFGNYGVSVRLRDKYKKLFGSTSVEYHTVKNNFTFTDLSTIAREDRKLEHASVQRIGFSKSLGIQLNQRNTISASVYYAQVAKELPPSMLMVASKEKLFDRDVWAALKWKREGKRSELSATASYIYGNQQYFDNNEYTFHHLYQANKNLIRYKLNLGHHLHLDVGADVFTESARSDSAYRSKPHLRYWQAAFASLKYVPKKWVAAQVLIREDVIDAKFSPIQGLVGVEVKPANWFIVKGNVSRNFRPATLNDLYWVPGGNPDVKSETGFSWEAGIGFKAKTKAFQFRFDATYFQSEIDHWIIWLPLGNVWTPQNKRAVSSKGVEAKLEATATIGKVLLKLNGAYTYVSSTVKKGSSETDVSVGHQLIYVPAHQAKAYVSVHFAKLFLLIGHQYTGLRYTTSDNKSSLPAYQLSYASVGYEYTFKKHTIGINLTVDNLFDKDYQTIAWRPMPGRSFLINLNYQFL
ncbi:MAG: TonB-dependent receptor [Flavobacteriales bacterium]|nr:TonB-dependent receptor [Flavobacteriales bacterium]